MSKIETKLANLGSNTPSTPMSMNSKSFTSTSKREDFDLVVAGTCPHCRGHLGKEIRGRGAGVNLICKKCGHRWYLNRRIKRTRCLTCFAEQRRNMRNIVRNNMFLSALVPNAPTLDAVLVSQRGNGLYSGAGADESRWASRTSNPLGGGRPVPGGFDSHALPPASAFPKDTAKRCSCTRHDHIRLPEPGSHSTELPAGTANPGYEPYCNGASAPPSEDLQPASATR
jgi:hypothetical protein